MSKDLRRNRVLIADDHSIILSGIKMILSFQLKISNIFECNNLSELIDSISKNKPTHLILDVTFPEGSSLNLLDEIIQKFPKLRILILTMHPKIMFEHILRKNPTIGFCEKKSTEHEITHKLEAFINAEATKSVGKTATKKQTLSNREQQILKLLLEGGTTQNIANHLGIKSNTVSTIKNRIFDKLQVNNIVELMQLYN